MKNFIKTFVSINFKLEYNHFVLKFIFIKDERVVCLWLLLMFMVVDVKCFAAHRNKL
jgi:hypothetical protein